jgi:hypothetical protein
MLRFGWESIRISRGKRTRGGACSSSLLIDNWQSERLVWQGRPDAAEPWVQRAERTLTADTQPVAVLAIRYTRRTLELERGRNAAALAALEAGEPLA